MSPVLIEAVIAKQEETMNALVHKQAWELGHLLPASHTPKLSIGVDFHDWHKTLNVWTTYISGVTRYFRLGGGLSSVVCVSMPH